MKFNYKTLIVIVLILLTTKINAQQDSIKKVFDDVIQFYKELDKTEMQTDYLFNSGFLILNDLEDIYQNKPIITSSNKWKYYYLGVINSNLKNKLPIDSSLIKFNKPNKYSISDIKLSILYYKGDYLPDMEIKNIIAKKASEPKFKQINIFTGAPMISISYNRTINFKFTPNKFLTNQNNISELLINFEDGTGYYKINYKSNQTFKISYNSVGEKNLRFKLITNTGDTLLSYSKINIISLENPNPDFVGYLPDSTDENFDIFATNLKSFDPNSFSIHKLKFEYYEGCDSLLDKPVIITEGFDMAGDMDLDFLYDKWEKAKIITKLRERGYDVFFVNFNDPDNSIQENVTRIKNLIYQIDIKIEDHNFEWIYIGESMGGIIGRIALKQFENQGYDHKFGLYISWDSPHKGANIPIGIQWLVADIGVSLPLVVAASYMTAYIEDWFGWDIPYVDIFQVMNSIGARQLIARHYLGYNKYNEFQTYLDNLGYPSECRNIAFVNGSNVAIQQKDYNLVNAIAPGTVAFKKTIFLGIYNISTKAWYSKTNVTGQKVARTAIIKFLPVWYPPFVKPLFYYFRHYQDFDNKPFDYAPGSFVTSEIGVFKKQNTKFTFVPTVSALDIDNSIWNQGAFFYYNNNSSHNTSYLLNNNLTPFDDIYSGFDNSRHTNIESRVIEDIIGFEIMYDNMYIQNRIIDKIRDFEARDKIVAGKDVSSGLLTTLYGPYGVADSHTKHIKQNNVIIKNGTTVTMQAGNIIEFEDGFEVEEGADFEATVGINPCTQNTKSQKQYIAPPQIAGRTNVCGKTTYTTNCTGNCEIEWQLTGENVDIYSIGEEFTIDSLPYGQYTLYCTKITDIGLATRTKVIKAKCNIMYNDMEQQIIANKQLQNEDIVLYPNPANSEFTILVNTKDQIAFNIEIKDVFGKTIKSKNNLSNNAKIDIKELSDGVYFVKIITNGNELTKKLIKN